MPRAQAKRRQASKDKVATIQAVRVKLRRAAERGPELNVLLSDDSCAVQQYAASVDTLQQAMKNPGTDLRELLANHFRRAPRLHDPHAPRPCLRPTGEPACRVGGAASACRAGRPGAARGRGEAG